MTCDYCQDEICVNADSPKLADYCPVPFESEICKYAEDECEIDADMVRVVRCKNCMHHTGSLYCFIWNKLTDNSGYCYRGN